MANILEHINIFFLINSYVFIIFFCISIFNKFFSLKRKLSERNHVINNNHNKYLLLYYVFSTLRHATKKEIEPSDFWAIIAYISVFILIYFISLFTRRAKRDKTKLIVEEFYASNASLIKR